MSIRLEQHYSFSKIKRRIKAANGFENDKTGNYFPCGGMLR